MIHEKEFDKYTFAKLKLKFLIQKLSKKNAQTIFKSSLIFFSTSND